LGAGRLAGELQRLRIRLIEKEKLKKALKKTNPVYLNVFSIFPLSGAHDPFDHYEKKRGESFESRSVLAGGFLLDELGQPMKKGKSDIEGDDDKKEMARTKIHNIARAPFLFMLLLAPARARPRST
jgi:hypothetical protein